MRITYAREVNRENLLNDLWRMKSLPVQKLGDFQGFFTPKEIAYYSGREQTYVYRLMNELYNLGYVDKVEDKHPVGGGYSFHMLYRAKRPTEG